jgi:hypothetical protein
MPGYPSLRLSGQIFAREEVVLGNACDTLLRQEVRVSCFLFSLIPSRHFA